MARSSIKGQVWTAVITGVFILAGAIISSPQWFKFFFPDQYIQQESLNPKILPGNNSSTTPLTDSLGVTSVYEGTENIAIEELELCPVNSVLPSYFFLKVKNRGTKALRNLLVTVDFGRAKYEQFEYLVSTHNQKVSVDTTHNNKISISLPKMDKNDTYSLYCLLSQPVFSTITITGDNLRRAKEYSYQEFLNSEFEPDSKANGWMILLGLIGIPSLAILSAYLLMVVFHFLKRKNLIG